jgi:hypothetical protein
VFLCILATSEDSDASKRHQIKSEGIYNEEDIICIVAGMFIFLSFAFVDA